MTVAELVALLQEYLPNRRVVLNGQSGECGDVELVEVYGQDEDGKDAFEYVVSLGMK